MAGTAVRELISVTSIALDRSDEVAAVTKRLARHAEVGEAQTPSGVRFIRARTRDSITSIEAGKLQRPVL